MPQQSVQGANDESQHLRLSSVGRVWSGKNPRLTQKSSGSAETEKRDVKEKKQKTAKKKYFEKEGGAFIKKKQTSNKKFG